MSAKVAGIFRMAIDEGAINAAHADWKIINDILNCRTEALGGHLYECGSCGKSIPVYNSCRNRHCPQCQGAASARWLEARTKELLPVPYFHLVFTIPHELNGVCLQNKQLLFDILFRSVTKTLHDVAKKRLGGALGFFSVLHTWGKKMEFHPHIHTVVPGVVMKTDGSIGITPQNYLLPKNVLSPVFRAIFIRALVKAYRTQKLSFFGDQAHLYDPAQFFALIKEVKEKHWICYAKKPFAGPSVVLKYLARYTHRVAIAERRIIKVAAGRVSFSYKDYTERGKVKTLSITVAEFARRFLLHTLPREFVRIRYSGLLSSGKRKSAFATVRAHFNIQRPIALLPLKPPCCPRCGGSHLIHSRELLPAKVSSLTHKTKALSCVT